MEKTNQKTNQIKALFIKLVKAHQYYRSGDNNYRIRLTAALEPVLAELDGLGVERTLSEGLLIWGKEFADSLGSGELATLDDAERIFGAKARELTERERRESAIAQKHCALVYRAIAGPEPKIEILLKK